MANPTLGLAVGVQRLVEKPWGSELVFTESRLPYCGKLLTIQAGHRLSLQVHDSKTETICLLTGSALLTLEDEGGAVIETPMELQVGYTVLPGRRHRIRALADSVLAEASTPETGTTFRLEDDYGRPDELR
jgi:oxalate decarboxylase/phosphoglucose isomerase-like protein (cupin superfamily)